MNKRLKITLMVFWVAICASLVAACGGTQKLARSACPPAGVLATADSWHMAEQKVQLTGVSRDCVKTKDDKLLAKVVVRGTQSQIGKNFPLFLAVVGENGNMIARTQYRLTAADETFSLVLPDFQFSELKNRDPKAELIVGFVLTKEQLAANRATLRKQLGLVRE